MNDISMTNSELDATFSALADVTRRRILERLALGDATVSELAAPFNLSQPTISKHLKVLEAAGLIRAGRDAQRRPRSLLRPPLDEAIAWLNGYQNPGSLQFSAQGDRQIVMKRTFHAPRSLIFDAFTKPAFLKRWFYGKPGGRLAVSKVARRAGERFRYLWRDADGVEMGMQGTCLEFVRPERIVATEKFDHAWYPGEAVGTIELKEKNGSTVLTQTIQYQSRAAREQVLRSGMEHGVAFGYERLAAFLETVKSERRKTR